jgi:hypothetical protein
MQSLTAFFACCFLSALHFIKLGCALSSRGVCLSATAAAAYKHLRLVHTCRIDLVRNDGKLLRSFAFDECDAKSAAAGGVNEMRGISRPHLLGALAAQLPEGALQFSSSVMGIISGSDGG